MTKQLRIKLLLLFVLACSVQSVWGDNTYYTYKFIDNGIYYTIDNNCAFVCAQGYNADYKTYFTSLSGDVVIPDSVVYNGVTYPVTRISSYAFCSSQINSITIPRTVNYIEQDAFRSNYNDGVYSPKSYICIEGDSVNIVNDSALMGGGTRYYYNSGIDYVSCPVYVASDQVFNSISSPKRGYIAASGKLGYYCSYSVDTVKVTFQKISNTEKGTIRVPDSSWDNSSVDTLAIKNGLMPGRLYTFTGFTYQSSQEEANESLRSIPFEVKCHVPDLSFSYKDVSTTYTTVQAKFGNLDRDVSAAGIEIKGKQYAASDTTDFKAGNYFTVTIPNLAPGQEYTLKPYAIYKDSLCYAANEYNVTTATPTVTGSVVNSGQTFVRFKVEAYQNDTLRYSELGVVWDIIYSEDSKMQADENGYVTVRSFPSSTVVVRPYAIYCDSAVVLYRQNQSGYSRYQYSISGSTSTLNPTIVVKKSPTAFTAKGTCSLEEGLSIAKENLKLYKVVDKKNVEITPSQLDPNTTYYAEYSMTVEGFGMSKTFSAEKATIYTPAIEWTTLPAKGTSNTVAVLAATTNIDDDEAVTGFEWRRYDAPDLVPSTQSECPVIDGELVGALKNLSANTYYKFRPYYTSATGNTYYGEWSAFGTADAYVYFDPTVKTYSASDIAENSAKVRGYVIQGSGKITKQGFEYWVVKQNTRGLYSTAANDVTVVEADGTKISTVLTGLAAGTTYAYRVFATTDEGTTYGEEQTFTTAVSTGISSVVADASDEMTVTATGSAQRGDVALTVSGRGEQTQWTAYTLTGVAVGNGTLTADGTAHALGLAPQQGIVVVRVQNAQGVQTLKLR